MDINQIVFDDYIICPLCKKKMGSLTSSHLQFKHGFSGLQEFKMKYSIPMGIPLVAKNMRAQMQKRGKKRAGWFRENVMPKGIEQAKKADLVPKELRKHGGVVRKGKNWQADFINKMRKKGWLDLHDAALRLGYTYNYMRKCASDGRLKTYTEKGIRFTKIEWIKKTEKLLELNRIKYRPDLIH